MMDDYYKIFVAKDKKTGMFRTHDRIRLYGMRGWLNFKNPSLEEVQKQLDFLEKEYPNHSFTDDIDKAGIWNEEDIKQYSKYLPNVEFIEVTVGISGK